MDKISKYSIGVAMLLLLSSIIPNAVNASGSKAVAEQDFGSMEKRAKEWRPKPEHVASSKKDQIEEYMNRHWQGETTGERLLPVAQLKYGDNVSVFNISGRDSLCGWRAICAGVKADQQKKGKLTLIDDVEVQQLLSGTADTVLELFYKYQALGAALTPIFDKFHNSICSEVFEYPPMIMGYLFAEKRFDEVKEYAYVNILLNELRWQDRERYGIVRQNEYLVKAYAKNISNGNVQLEKVLVPFVQKYLASRGEKCNIEITTFCLADGKVRFQSDSLQWFYSEDENAKPIRMIYLDYGKGNNGHYNIVLENCITEIENLLGKKGFSSLDRGHECMCCISRPNYQANGEKLSRFLTLKEKSELQSVRTQIEESIKDLGEKLVKFGVNPEEVEKLRAKLVQKPVMISSAIEAAGGEEGQDLTSFVRVTGMTAEKCHNFFQEVGQYALNNGEFLVAAAALMDQVRERAKESTKGPKDLQKLYEQSRNYQIAREINNHVKKNIKDNLFAAREQLGKCKVFQKFSSREQAWIKFLCGETVLSEGNSSCFTYPNLRGFWNDSRRNIEKGRKWDQVVFPSWRSSAVANKDLFISKNVNLWKELLEKCPAVRGNIVLGMQMSAICILHFWGYTFSFNDDGVVLKDNPNSPLRDFGNYNNLRGTRFLQALELFGCIGIRNIFGKLFCEVHDSHPLFLSCWLEGAFPCPCLYAKGVSEVSGGDSVPAISSAPVASTASVPEVLEGDSVSANSSAPVADAASVPEVSERDSAPAIGSAPVANTASAARRVPMRRMSVLPELTILPRSKRVPGVSKEDLVPAIVSSVPEVSESSSVPAARRGYEEILQRIQKDFNGCSIFNSCERNNWSYWRSTLAGFLIASGKVLDDGNLIVDDKEVKTLMNSVENAI
ncbi:MAG: hypothetical protein LBS71_00600, partial [Puniceicoccales bacterium]|nr:hypothetical protein [Puniceicoccales bacterium]